MRKELRETQNDCAKKGLYIEELEAQVRDLTSNSKSRARVRCYGWMTCLRKTTRFSKVHFSSVCPRWTGGMGYRTPFKNQEDPLSHHLKRGCARRFSIVVLSLGQAWAHIHHHHHHHHHNSHDTFWLKSQKWTGEFLSPRARPGERTWSIPDPAVIRLTGGSPPVDARWV